MAYFDGITVDGVNIHIQDDPYAVKLDTDPRILFDGREVEVSHISRLRDGGTTLIQIKARGKLVINGRRYGRPFAIFDDVPMTVKEGGGGRG